MKILQVHNYYDEVGGEEAVLKHEHDLLTDHGHDVRQFTTSNREIKPGGLKAKLRAGASYVWSQQAYRSIRKEMEAFEPDVVHVHNTFPLLGPSIYWAAQRLKIPVIQTLHNYRFSCANGLLMREGGPCERCVGHAPLPAIQHRCYRNSLLASSAMALSQELHRMAGTYRDRVDAYIALTEFAKAVFIRAGLPAERIFVKPNFVMPMTPTEVLLRPRRKRIVFVGRLSPVKGVDRILEAWRQIDHPEAELLIIGDGPERASLESSVSDLRNIRWLGWMGPDEIQREVSEARFLVMASRAYENFPMVILEAFSARTPVIVPDHAGFPEIVTAAKTGLLFSSGDTASLAATLSQALILESEVWERMSRAAIDRFERCYSPEANYAVLMRIYQAACDRRKLEVCA